METMDEIISGLLNGRDSEVIYTGMEELGIAHFPNILCTSGLGPCIAIGFYDTKNRVAFMTHQLGYGNYLIATLDDIRKVSDDLSKLRVAATGNSLVHDNKEDREQELMHRRDVTEILLQHFDKKQIKTRWTKDYMLGYLVIDTKTGKFIIGEEYFES